MKKCSRCGKEKVIADFVKVKKSKSGVASFCKKCRNERAVELYHKHTPEQRKRHKETQKRYYEQNTERCKKLARKKRLKSQYGITPEQFDDMYISQGGRCAVCGKHQADLPVRLAIDHCHKTGQVRGLLCTGCNTGIGSMEDSISILKNAITYLKSVIA